LHYNKVPVPSLYLPTYDKVNLLSLFIFGGMGFKLRASSLLTTVLPLKSHHWLKFKLLNFGHSYRQAVVPLWFHFAFSQWLRMLITFFILICWFIVKCTWSLWSVWSNLLFIFCWVIVCSLYILDISPLLGICFTNISTSLQSIFLFF
jgi:hypothetical protein